MRLHLNPLGFRQYVAIHATLESQARARRNPDSQQTLVNGVAAPGLFCRPYYRRYDEASLDLCDVLANHDARGRIGLDALCRAMGLPGKSEGIDGSGVADLVAQGRLDEVAAYCVGDVIATYRVFLAFERMRGGLDTDAYARSCASLDAFIAASAADHPASSVRAADAA